MVERADCMKESRLFKIIYYLLEKGRVSAPELAKQFEVSVRTIYRDVDVLSEAGIPIYATTGRNGGIQLLDGYVLEKVLFSDQEKREVLAALQSLSVIDNTYERAMLTKLSALFKTHSESWFEVDFGRWGHKEQEQLKFEQLKQATIHHKAMVIVYVSAQGKTTRKIHPLKLLYKSKEWYVKAYCTEKQDFRIFKINRIVKYEQIDEDFVPVDFPDFKEIEANDYQEIVLQFSKEVAYRVYDEFDARVVTVQEAGELIVASRLPEDSWLISYLLSFGSEVQVIEPAYLRNVLADEAKKIYEKNKP